MCVNMAITKSDFIVSCVRHLLEDNISVHLHQIESVDTYGGWFDGDENKEFVVALKNPLGFEIFIHEYCHYLQWKDNKCLWNSCMDYYDTLFYWIDNEEYETNEDELAQSLHHIILLEHDCEKRVLELTKNGRLIRDLDMDRYRKAINAYLFHYHINRELRERPKTTIYTDKILQKMPKTFHKDVTYYLDKNNMSNLMKKTLLTKYKKSKVSIDKRR